ncbi:Glycine/D-amino acid oxidase [Epibacterium ulvae]|uniref:Glycine/D-amino acid oxidase n=1 Tax=Epibacterium ulvae TaxID=1156985 RepID=A0A1G5R647_9RHOB|nr:FAD-dependent oxidoreductase [Epibacterium ulvae]SCZ69517.1 Glycine/D-amino acid oxidase [Epibacterium ulvae]
MAMTDVTIRGAGIFGLSIAWRCAQLGARVQVIDPKGAGAGSSGGVVGALAPHVPENWNAKKAFQFESLILSEHFWAEVEGTGGLSTGYGRTGRLQPIADDAALTLAKERAQNAQDLWQGKADWRIIDAAQAGPWAPISPMGLLIHDTLSARMHPRQTCAALVAALGTHGVAIKSEGADQGFVVHATGYAGLKELNTGHSRLIGTGVKGQAAVLAYRATEAPQLFADALHIIPHANGTVAIGSTTERDFENPDTPDALLEDVIDRARRTFPVLEQAEVLERWAGVRPRSRSRAPMLGAIPDRPGHFIANGGFKIGFGMAPNVARVMADLILENRDQIPKGFRFEDNL